MAEAKVYALAGEDGAPAAICLLKMMGAKISEGKCMGGFPRVAAYRMFACSQGRYEEVTDHDPARAWLEKALFAGGVVSRTSSKTQ